MSANFFTQEEADRARHADLASFLLRTDPLHYRREGNSLRLIDPSQPRGKQKKSISIKFGASWWHDFATNESGNCVEYLTDKMGYTLVDAIKVLAGENISYHPVSASHVPPAPQPAGPPEFPKPSDKRPSQMYAYLMNRGIPPETIKQMQKLGILYQSQEYANLVFITRKHDFAEIRGTYTYGEAFHSVVRPKPDRFWYFSSGTGKPERAFVCEAAIDTVSLYLLLQKEGSVGNSLFASIAGVTNQQAINRIKRLFPKTILAVDNDRAGQLCRERNPECSFLLPQNKDWNEDLQKAGFLQPQRRGQNDGLQETSPPSLEESISSIKASAFRTTFTAQNRKLPSQEIEK